jgi:hypothetical protein
MLRELTTEELSDVSGGAWSTYSYDGGRVQGFKLSICGTSFAVDSGNGLTCSATNDSKGTTSGCTPS